MAQSFQQVASVRYGFVVRRGLDKADIYSIALSPNVQWLVVSSDKGTVHVFSLRVRVGGEEASTQIVPFQSPAIVQQNSSTPFDPLSSPTAAANANSSLYFMRGVLPKYFSSEWSFAQFHLPEGTRYTAAFGLHNSILIVGMDGSFYKCTLDPVNGGQMSQKEYVRFLKSDSQRCATR
ncbi:hypothetical protein ZIOFF_054876 [Zingiber officinale]|uniref:Uncharacterized protein n=1 Tax=Zingiber officinale TaxID=94328 RepID=A0A8J5KMW9_ZINOF|nr:hypothetical protein ZIOFF_054876 [Zingiber officinale]